MKEVLKEAGIYFTIFFSLLIAIVLPVEGGIWWVGILRGFCLAIFIYLIPVWVKIKSGGER